MSNLDRLRERATHMLGRAEFGDDVLRVAAEDVVALFDEADALRERVEELGAEVERLGSKACCEHRFVQGHGGRPVCQHCGSRCKA